MQDFHNLDVWKEAHQLTLAIFRLTESQTSDTAFLFTQFRRVATVMTARITEGCSREGDDELARCLHLSRACCYQMEYLLLLAHDLSYIDPPTHEALLAQLIEVRKMLSGLLRTVKS